MPFKKIMIALALILAAAPVLAAGCTIVTGSVTGSGETVTWDMDFKDFNRIETGNAFDIEVTRSDEFSVRITVDKVLNEYLRVEQRGSTVHIKLDPRNAYIGTIQRAVVTLPDLRRLELSGASSGTVTGFSTTQSIDFEVSGASRLELVQMKSGDADFNVSGASRVSGGLEMANGKFDVSGASSLELDGKATDIRIEASGASHVRLPEFPTDTVEVDLSGASSAIINVSTRMDVELSGASSLRYIGSPKLGNIDISGGSSIDPY